MVHFPKYLPMAGPYPHAYFTTALSPVTGFIEEGYVWWARKSLLVLHNRLIAGDNVLYEFDF